MTASTHGNWLSSSRNNPCPICGREKDGDCRISRDGQEVICHHPKDCRPGEVVRGRVGGQTWAFTKNTSDGRAGHFTIDKPRSDGQRRGSNVVPSFPQPRWPEQSATPPAALPVPPQAPVQLLRFPVPPVGLVRINPNGPPKGDWEKDHKEDYILEATYRYSKTQETERLRPVDGGSKRFQPNHCEDNFGFIRGAGADPWPLWRQEEALAAATANPGYWLLEPEGEKCVEIAREGGLVAISQPGHAHKPEQIRPRYAALKAAGAAGIVFLADKDQRGVKRAQEALEAAAAAGLPLMVLPAAEVWRGLPDAGSIDDAPGSPAERVATLLKVVDEIKPDQWVEVWTDCQQQLGLTEKEEEAAANQPYQVLGWCPNRESVWYRHRQTAQIAAVKPSGQAELLKLAPLNYWEAAHPIQGKEGNVIRCDWGKAASELIEEANHAGVFEPERARGRGVWEDNGRVVWHLGKHLEVDGQKTSLTEINSAHYYGLLPALSIDPEVTPLDDEHGRKILQVLRDCNWQRPSDYLHLAGFVVLSNVGGALRKRPGLQVTSPYGSGKSDTIENTISPLQGGLGRISTASTEAGIRQLIGRDALPCTVDESEAEDGNKREAQLRLVRYSFDGVPQVKGTPSGEPIVFCLRSSLALAGINAPITNPADLSRMAVISRATLPADQWAVVSRQRAEVITTEIGQRLIRRTVSNLPTLLANITTFGTVISGQIAGNESGRAGDTYGALLAGAHHLTSTKALRESEALAWLDSVGWSFNDTNTDDTDRTAGAEGRQCLEHLLANEMTWFDRDDRDGPSTGTITVRELVGLARNSLTAPRKGKAAREALGRKGLRATDEGLAVARGAPGIQSVYGSTKWKQGGHAERLLEIEGANRTSAVVRFPSGGVHRAVVVPWGSVGVPGEE